jgi:hypothetical protein
VTANSYSDQVDSVLNSFMQDGNFDGKRYRNILMPYRQGNHDIILQHTEGDIL